MTPEELKEQLDPYVKRVEEAAPGRVLDQITAATSVASELTRLGDFLINLFVEQARSEGYSWAEIGTSLGVTRQAAQQRLGRFQQVPMKDGIREKGSPFAAWREAGAEGIEVQVEPGSAWQGLVSLDGHSVLDLVAAARKADPRRWFKRLSEDLDEVYKELDADLGATATAVLVDAAGRNATRDVDVTFAKRKAALLHNRAESRPDASA